MVNTIYPSESTGLEPIQSHQTPNTTTSKASQSTVTFPAHSGMAQEPRSYWANGVSLGQINQASWTRVSILGGENNECWLKAACYTALMLADHHGGPVKDTFIQNVTYFYTEEQQATSGSQSLNQLTTIKLAIESCFQLNNYGYREDTQISEILRQSVQGLFRSYQHTDKMKISTRNGSRSCFDIMQDKKGGYSTMIGDIVRQFTGLKNFDAQKPDPNSPVKLLHYGDEVVAGGHFDVQIFQGRAAGFSYGSGLGYGSAVEMLIQTDFYLKICNRERYESAASSTSNKTDAYIEQQTNVERKRKIDHHQTLRKQADEATKAQRTLPENKKQMLR